MQLTGYDTLVDGTYAPGGGGFCLTNSSVDMEYTTFQNCSGTVGGALLLHGSTEAQFYALQVSHCSVNRTFEGEAAGMYLDAQVRLHVTEGLFESNEATRGGALVMMDSASATFEHTVFRANSATKGGGIYLDSAAALHVAEESYFEQNSAILEGGAIYAKGSASLTLDRSYFDLNNGSSGGAIALRENAWLEGHQACFRVSDVPLVIKMMPQCKRLTGTDVFLSLSLSFRRIIQRLVGAPSP